MVGSGRVELGQTTPLPNVTVHWWGDFNDRKWGVTRWVPRPGPDPRLLFLPWLSDRTEPLTRVWVVRVECRIFTVVRSLWLGVASISLTPRSPHVTGVTGEDVSDCGSLREIPDVKVGQSKTGTG